MAKRRVKRTVARGILLSAHENRVARTAKKVKAGKVKPEDVVEDIREEVREKGVERGRG